MKHNNIQLFNKAEGDAEAKRKLKELLKRYTTGRILGLLSEIYQECLDEARTAEDAEAAREFTAKRDALDIFGTGLDARWPEG